MHIMQTNTTLFLPTRFTYGGFIITSSTIWEACRLSANWSRPFFLKGGRIDHCIVKQGLERRGRDKHTISSHLLYSARRKRIQHVDAASSRRVGVKSMTRCSFMLGIQTAKATCGWIALGWRSSSTVPSALERKFCDGFWRQKTSGWLACERRSKT